MNEALIFERVIKALRRDLAVLQLVVKLVHESATHEDCAGAKKAD